MYRIRGTYGRIQRRSDALQQIGDSQQSAESKRGAVKVIRYMYMQDALLLIIWMVTGKLCLGLDILAVISSGI